MDFDFKALFVWLFIGFACIPFAVWKWVEIIIFIVHHVHIN